MSVSGLTTTTGTQASVAAVAGEFPESGASTAFDGFTTVSAEASGTTISAAYSGALNIVDPSDCAVVMVEVCYFVDAPGPDTDDYAIKYKTEAGSGY